MTVQATGHHTGTQFELPGRPPVAPSGRRVRLEPELMKVRVEGGRVHEIVVSRGAAEVRLGSAQACETFHVNIPLLKRRFCPARGRGRPPCMRR